MVDWDQTQHKLFRLYTKQNNDMSTAEFDLLGSALLGLDNTLARSYSLWLWADSWFVVEYNRAWDAFSRW